jgi:hypothetical protein
VAYEVKLGTLQLKREQMMSNTMIQMVRWIGQGMVTGQEVCSEEVVACVATLIQPSHNKSIFPEVILDPRESRFLRRCGFDLEPFTDTDGMSSSALAILEQRPRSNMKSTIYQLC